MDMMNSYVLEHVNAIYVSEIEAEKGANGAVVSLSTCL